MIGIGGRTRWTQAELRSAPPAVLDAARWEVFASYLWPSEQIVAEIEAPDRPLSDTQMQQRKVQARLNLQRIRRALLPPDEMS